MMSRALSWALLAVVSLLFASSCTPTFALANEIKIAEGLAMAPAVAAATNAHNAQVASSGAVVQQTPVRVDAVLGTPYVLAGQRQKAFLKVGLEGLELPKGKARAAVNLAIVLDKSSSMAGDKIREAKRAAIMAVNALDSRDVVSVVTYDSTVSVIVPAQRVTEKEAIVTAIARIEEGGSTALFAGVSKGAAELRKLFSRNRVNRVILLSDGMANIGPSSPGELASLGISLAREGMSVTTIGLGLGYNEDLMMKLAMASDGNHAFVENATELARIFELEFGDAMSVVAQDVDVDIELVPGVKPIRVLGRDAIIDGQKISTRLNQVVSGHEKYLLIEVELPPRTGAGHHLADVAVAFDDLATHERARVSSAVAWNTTRSPTVVERKINEEVEVIAIEMVANEQNKLAVALRDQGQVQQARQVLEDNESFLRKKNQKYKSKRLKKLEEFNRMNADNLERPEQWRRSRKQMREEQFDIEMQTTLH